MRRSYYGNGNRTLNVLSAALIILLVLGIGIMIFAAVKAYEAFAYYGSIPLGSIKMEDAVLVGFRVLYLVIVAAVGYVLMSAGLSVILPLIVKLLGEEE